MFLWYPPKNGLNRTNETDIPFWCPPKVVSIDRQNFLVPPKNDWDRTNNVLLSVYLSTRYYNTFHSIKLQICTITRLYH
jgi:hypothetical protein